jgi:hypothetical protein
VSVLYLLLVVATVWLCGAESIVLFVCSEVVVCFFSMKAALCLCTPHRLGQGFMSAVLCLLCYIALLLVFYRAILCEWVQVSSARSSSLLYIALLPVPDRAMFSVCYVGCRCQTTSYKNSASSASPRNTTAHFSKSWSRACVASTACTLSYTATAPHPRAPACASSSSHAPRPPCCQREISAPTPCTSFILILPTSWRQRSPAACPSQRLEPWYSAGWPQI